MSYREPLSPLHHPCYQVHQIHIEPPSHLYLEPPREMWVPPSEFLEASYYLVGEVRGQSGEGGMVEGQFEAFDITPEEFGEGEQALGGGEREGERVFRVGGDQVGQFLQQ
jgi:hypothetical protein